MRVEGGKQWGFEELTSRLTLSKSAGEARDNKLLMSMFMMVRTKMCRG